MQAAFSAYRKCCMNKETLYPAFCSYSQIQEKRGAPKQKHPTNEDLVISRKLSPQTSFLQRSISSRQ